MYYINVENNHSKTYFYSIKYVNIFYLKCLKIKFNNNHEEN